MFVQGQKEQTQYTATELANIIKSNIVSVTFIATSASVGAKAVQEFTLSQSGTNYDLSKMKFIGTGYSNTGSDYCFFKSVFNPSNYKTVISNYDTTARTAQPQINATYLKCY